MANVQRFTVENATLAFRNFEGKQGQYNREGERSFALFLDEGFANELRELGWNVKLLKPREPEDTPQAYLNVKVSMDSKYPPKIVMVSNHGKKLMTAADLKILDWARIANADVEVSPYTWNVNGTEGISAYLSTLYVQLEEDPFESKYDNVPDSAANTMTFEAVKSSEPDELGVSPFND